MIRRQVQSLAPRKPAELRPDGSSALALKGPVVEIAHEKWPIHRISPVDPKIASETTGYFR